MPWSKWWSCPCHQQESPHPADHLCSLDSQTHTQRGRDIHKHEITDQECWQLASARLDIGPGRTRSAGNQGQAQHGPSSEAQQPVDRERGRWLLEFRMGLDLESL